MKSKQEQIEEIVCKVKNAIGNNGTYRSYFDYIEMGVNDVDHAAEESAEEIYKAGYRKASDVIDEFVERLRKLLIDKVPNGYKENYEHYNYPIDTIEKFIFNIAAEIRQEVESGELCDRDEVIDRLMKAKDTSTLTDKEMEFFIKHNEAVRKETAREILSELKFLYAQRQKEYTNWDTDKVNAVTIEWLNADLECFAEEYGIELFGKTEQVEDEE